MKKFLVLVAVLFVAVLTFVGVSQIDSISFGNITIDFEDSGFPEMVRLDFEDSGFPEMVRIDFEDSGFPEMVRL